MRTLAGLLVVLNGAVLAAANGQPAVFAISGRIEGLAGSDRVLVVVEGPRRVEATTRVKGLWRLDGLPPGAYTVTPHHGRYTFDPPHRRVEVTDGHVPDVDSHATVAPPEAEGTGGGDAPEPEGVRYGNNDCTERRM
ncbi:MAG TPA: hypothetical protein P5234_12080 [Thermoanaerobaculaceae bacterium]|nr:hypothetical protein [Thermoanaerobaculaceae bacterium]HRS16971.1 hypothetical protein [Thermoanaerobaculaceae bacterium]